MASITNSENKTKFQTLVKDDKISSSVAKTILQHCLKINTRLYCQTSEIIDLIFKHI